MYQQRKAADSSEDCPHPRDDFDDNQPNGAKIRVVHMQALTIQLDGMRARCRVLQRSARSWASANMPTCAQQRHRRASRIPLWTGSSKLRFQDSRAL